MLETMDTSDSGSFRPEILPANTDVTENTVTIIDVDDSTSTSHISAYTISEGTRSPSTVPPVGNGAPDTAPLAVLLDPYRCNADEHSETDIVRLLSDLNSEIGDAFVHGLVSLEERMQKYYYKKGHFDPMHEAITKTLDPRTESPLVQELCRAREVHSRVVFDGCIIEGLLHDTLCTELYTHFFSGDFFFGIMIDETQKTGMEASLRALLQQETPWSVVQRWRSLGSKASPYDAHTVKQKIENIIGCIMRKLWRAFCITYPINSKRFKAFINELLERFRKSIIRIVNLAHKLSIILQQDMVTSRLKVVVAPALLSSEGRTLYLPLKQGMSMGCGIGPTMPVDGEHVLGTAYFGLDSYRDYEEKVVKSLVLPRVITISIFNV